MEAHNEKIVAKLNQLLEMEISGVVRYLHYSFMIMGPNRIPIQKWFHDQAQEGYQHATMLGEKITALGGHPSLNVSKVPETQTHAALDILKESLVFEEKAIDLYHEVLKECESNIALEEMVRELIRTETEHIDEVKKMLITKNT
ncbi:MAG: bacterioferritin [Bdellovibrionaceae bacterium]|nr:bacterioferritin [Pseudobdellovibrionaceae bacterium]